MAEPVTMASGLLQRSKLPGALPTKSVFSPTACFVRLGEPVQCHTKFVTMKDLASPAQSTTWHNPAFENDMPFDELMNFYGYETDMPVGDWDWDTEAAVGSTNNEGVRRFSQHSTPSILGSPHGSRMMSPPHTRGWSDSLSDSEDDSWLPRGRKKVLVGPRYQADIPDIQTPYQEDVKLSCKSAALLWRFGCVSEADVEAYLREATAPSCLPLRNTSPVRDDERVLWELHRCNYKAREALRRSRANSRAEGGELAKWTVQEQKNFEQGMRVHGKDFNIIQANKVRTKSVGECVAYYYLTKHKTRRGPQSRTSKRKATIGLPGPIYTAGRANECWREENQRPERRPRLSPNYVTTYISQASSIHQPSANCCPRNLRTPNTQAFARTCEP
uniref:mesoderm induction early response protein 2-like isoform X1 n=3 Tax=Myxine glutinosa TaxID=7769 RepID=UPI00358DECDF